MLSWYRGPTGKEKSRVLTRLTSDLISAYAQVEATSPSNNLDFWLRFQESTFSSYILELPSIFAFIMALLRRGILATAALAALLAILITRKSPPSAAVPTDFIKGKNNTVLFFALAESGQINVQLATAQALMETHPDIKIHFASFAKVAEKVARVSSYAINKTPSAQPIIFHTIAGKDRLEGLAAKLNCTGIFDCIAHPPGARGVSILGKQLEIVLWAWTGEEHLAIFHRAIEITHLVDPAVVVVDFAFRPALDSMARMNWQHVIMSPLALADLFAPLQPYGAALWKFPA